MARVVWYGDKVAAQTRKNVATVLRATAARGVGEIVESFRTTPTGGHRGPYRDRSLPGQPPAQQTLQLTRGIAVDDSEADSALKVRLGVKAGQASRYGLYLELGTDKMRPRPYLRPWLTRIWPRLQKSLAGIVR